MLLLQHRAPVPDAKEAEGMGVCDPGRRVLMDVGGLWASGLREGCTAGGHGQGLPRSPGCGSGRGLSADGNIYMAFYQCWGHRETGRGRERGEQPQCPPPPFGGGPASRNSEPPPEKGRPVPHARGHAAAHRPPARRTEGWEPGTLRALSAPRPPCPPASPGPRG